jgi:hypothetical protein
MTDEELRTIVRAAVRRHLDSAPAAPGHHGLSLRPPDRPSHPGFARYALPTGTELEGPCLIEPAVRCNHCGYCQSHGY